MRTLSLSRKVVVTLIGLHARPSQDEDGKRLRIRELFVAAPVLAGHSQPGGFASVYAAQYPASGVINVDASPDLWTFVHVMQDVAAGCGGDALEVWRKMEQAFGLHLRPAATREFIMCHRRPRRDLLVGYWEDIFAMAPEQAAVLVNGALAAMTRAGVPYLLLLGSEPSPDTGTPLRSDRGKGMALQAVVVGGLGAMAAAPRGRRGDRASGHTGRAGSAAALGRAARQAPASSAAD
jgi:pimeloyl-ACP methyl ester carboxylesterase